MEEEILRDLNRSFIITKIPNIKRSDLTKARQEEGQRSRSRDPD